MRRKKGFTLIELLVVIAIIALLLSILLPSLSKAKDLAKSLVCSTRLKHYGLANMIYSTNNDSKLVPFSQSTTRPTTLAGKYIDERWVENKEFRIELDLASRRTVVYGDLESEWNDPWVFPKELLCPKFPARKIEASWADDPSFTNMLGETLVSYALNVEKWSSLFPNDRKYRGHVETQVKSPGDKIMFIDSNYSQTMRRYANYETYWDVFGDILSSGNYAQVSYRHNEKANIVFFDGHTDRLKKEEVFNPNVGGSGALWDVD